MSPEHQAVFDAALDLPATERAELAEMLLDSLPLSDEELARDGWVEVTDDEFFAELERRCAEYQNDPSIGIPWSQVKLEGWDESGYWMRRP